MLIEENWIKLDEFPTFIYFTDKLPSPNVKNPALHQGNDFVDVYKTFSGKHYEQYIKEILPLLISGTPETASTFARWYLGFAEPGETELNIGICEV